MNPKFSIEVFHQFIQEEIAEINGRGPVKTKDQFSPAEIAAMEAMYSKRSRSV